MGKSSIVTMVVGDRYRDLWQRFCAPNWKAYGTRHGLGLFVIDRPLDSSPLAQRRGLSWQKLLIGTIEALKDCDTLIWIDADIVINAEAAPCILEGVARDRVGAVRYHALLRHPMFAAAYGRLTAGRMHEDFCADLFRQHDLPYHADRMIQGGVLVVPRERLPLLETTYRKYSSAGSAQQHEQPFISHELATADALQLLDGKFNAVWYEYKLGVYFGDEDPDLNRRFVRRVLGDVYFLHFAGNQEDMSLLE
jgi:hypothetical protein